MTTAQKMRTFTGPAWLSHGFRPFFLLAALWAVVAMVLWIAVLSGAVALPLQFDPISWHAHEFLFGYLGAVIGGFVLTAIPNWTGRLPVLGWPLLGLVVLWSLGRVAMLLSALLPWQAVALADLSLAAALVVFMSREVLSGRNWRNLPVVVLIGIYGVANGIFHVEAARLGTASEGMGMRLGLAIALILIALIGGRIIPSFSRNWLAAKGAHRLPVPFGGADGGAMALTVAALAAFVAVPDTKATAWLLAAAGLAHLWRQSRWCGWQVRAEPLLWALHVAYAMLSLGFLAEATAEAGFIASAAARHVWLAGAIGLMTLAVMSRASLGHTGRALHAGPVTVTLYLSLVGSVVARVAAGLASSPMLFLHISAALWILAFGGFALAYAPVLLRPRLAPRRPSRQKAA
ncbi:NnrS family protein [Paracoccus rhizosphaerae]|uniref:NnrS family protein n=1 Tax=Paracoccus rhizosphaerae TaxID=1133347 RepID=A0ABV6CKV0_9RHOB|nr:NnrS family protein [Paracoccus rhizosphaerae]